MDGARARLEALCGDGLALRWSASLGDHLVAARPFAAGDVVLVDTPLLEAASAAHDAIGRTRGPWAEAALRAFCAAPAAVQASVLRMHAGAGCPPPDAEMRADIAAQLERCAGAPWRGPYSDETLRTVVLVWNLNAFAFGARGERAALFELGSKLTHSCDRSLRYEAAADGGRWRALRAVGAGEVLTVNYLGAHAAEMSTVARREALLASKLFVCTCARCSAPDDPARLLPCPGCHPRVGGALPPAVAAERGAVRYAAPRAAPRAAMHEPVAWLCSHCGAEWDDEAVLPSVGHGAGRAWERQCEQAVLRVDPRCAEGGCTATRDELEAALRLVTSSLGSRHWAGKRVRQIWAARA